MADEQDDAQKTEDPTPRKLEDAVKRGQVPSSREINSFMLLLMLAFMISLFGPKMLKDTQERLSIFVTKPEGFALDFNNFDLMMSALLADVFFIMLLPTIAIIAAIFLAAAVQNKWILSVEPIKPKWHKVSPMKGLKRLFSMRSMVEFIKGVIKIAIIATIITVAFWPYIPMLELMPDKNTSDILDFFAVIATRIMIGVCSVMFLIAVVDFLYQRFEYIKSLRMSKQEIKDEFKQQEGDPMVKQRLRSIRMERARKRMMAAVGNHVVKLHREQIANIKLDNSLNEGEWRELTLGEIDL